jgi:hypothetical protein
LIDAFICSTFWLGFHRPAEGWMPEEWNSGFVKNNGRQRQTTAKDGRQDACHTMWTEDRSLQAL